MSSMGALSVIIVLAIPIAIIALVAWTARRGGITFDVRQTYFYLVTFVTLAIAFFALSAVVGGVCEVAFANSPTPRHSYIWQQIANMLGMFVTAAPAWWLHWRGARRALARKRLLGLRVYLYAVTVIALVAVVIIGGMAASEILKALFGLVDFTSADGARTFWKNEISAVVNLLLALLVWLYHWRAVERVPADN